ncbi:MAG: GNAT family N-acetyltransferase [Sphingomonas sp.]|jgi:CelD/BcsL family acetyltransferase involved in cellulose biosynthesis
MPFSVSPFGHRARAPRGGDGAATGAAAVPYPLKFQVGARTLVSVERRLQRVALSLDDALEGRAPPLPLLHRAAHGYAITSLPEGQAAMLAASCPAMFAYVRQHYVRRYVDLQGGYERYLESLSANARSAIRRKARRVAQVSGGTLDVRRFCTVDELAQFHPIARRLAARTYQERLMGAGLPDDAQFLGNMYAAARQGQCFGWILSIGGRPAAYLYCSVASGTVRYDFVGHDPDFAAFSAGAVLQIAALRQLFDDGCYCRFDFTEGDGQHKRQFATGGVACVDMLLLRRTAANRATTLALAGFDRAVKLAKRVTDYLGMNRVARRLRR